jgi:transcriptional regulator with XRE-family HTH domain
MSKPPPLSRIMAGYGVRLRVARKALGLTAKALCTELNVEPGRWSHWENERHPPDIETMLALKHRHGVSLDWIFDGDPDRLPWHIGQGIVVQASHPDAAPEVRALLPRFGRPASTPPGIRALHETRPEPPG